MRNVEIKAKIKDLVRLKEKLQQLNLANHELITQHDIFFNVPRGRLKLRKFEDKSGELIYYERPDGEGPKLSSYDKSTIPSDVFDGLSKVLKRSLGLHGEVKKSRLLYTLDQTRIHVDTVEQLGNYLELEVVLEPDQTVEEGRAIAENIMGKLGIEQEDLIATAYVDLMLEQ